ncbi:MAG TPA: hypothetical protein VKE94_03320 [Gemmataceae bacterium]|nr:hypothetical protein [Gemmataceae bacterium]
MDEAGYGPNLGPFVMTAAACRVSPRRANADLWDVLRAAVRRAGEPEDERLLVEDSKLVYSPTRGLLDLETSTLVVTRHLFPEPVPSLAECLDRLSPGARDALGAEFWYVGDSGLPLVAEWPGVEAAASRFRDSCTRQHLEWGPVQSVVVCSSDFNALTDKWGTKAAVLSHCLSALVGRLRATLAGDESVCFFIDKHGGRNYYAATLQHAVPDAMVVAREESAGRSTYLALGLEREVRFTFQPRADAEHFCVAAASMVSKYLRELLMHEFNRFWQKHVPDVKPTAGYPSDAGRFLKDIAPALLRLGIDEAAVWRRK